MADLGVVNYLKLVSRDKHELKQLSTACQKDGFFYLEFDDVQSEAYLDLVCEVFHDAGVYFAQPLEDKMRDHLGDATLANVCGFKPLGTETGVVEDKKDGFEAFKIPTDRIYRFNHQETTEIAGVGTQLGTLGSFVRQSENVCSTIMSALSDALKEDFGLEDRLEWQHRPEAGSDSVAVINFYPLRGLPAHASIGHNAHTDMGSLTILFCSNWGLQIYSSDTERWEYVVPRPKSAIVNVGDALRFLSKQIFKSCLHRVVPHETWKSVDRYSLAYFLRPNRSQQFTDAGGVQWTTEEWNVRKFKSYKESHIEQQLSTVQTGRQRFLGVWHGPADAVRDDPLQKSAVKGA